MVSCIPGLGKEIMEYVGPARNGYTYEQHLAPHILKKKVAVDALDDWYAHGGDRALFSMYWHFSEPLILLVAFDAWLNGLMD